MHRLEPHAHHIGVMLVGILSAFTQVEGMLSNTSRLLAGESQKRADATGRGTNQRHAQVTSQGIVQDLVRQLVAREDSINEDAAARLVETHQDLMPAVIELLDKKTCAERNRAMWAILSQARLIEDNERYRHLAILMRPFIPYLVEVAKSERDDMARGLTGCWLASLLGEARPRELAGYDKQAGHAD